MLRQSGREEDERARQDTKEENQTVNKERMQDARVETLKINKGKCTRKFNKVKRVREEAKAIEENQETK